MGGGVTVPVVTIVSPLQFPINSRIANLQDTQTQTFQVSVDDGGESATIEWYLDNNNLQNSGLSVSLTAGKGTHKIRVVASNSAGSSDAIWTWNILYDYPEELYISYAIGKYCCCEYCTENPDNWNDAYCLHNAIIRWILYSDSSSLWTVNCCKFLEPGTGNQVVITPRGDNRFIYPASTLNHSVAAEYIGGNEIDITNWRFFQYDELDIPVGEEGGQIPPASGSSTRYDFVIWNVLDIMYDSNGLHIYQSPRKTFEIDENGEATWKENVAEEGWYPPL